MLDDRLPPLPEPYMSAKYVVQSNREAAKRMREISTDWVARPQTYVAGYVRALSGKEPKYVSGTFAYVEDGAPIITRRVRVVVDFAHSVEGIGDAEDIEKAEKIAALHALLKLVNADLIDNNGFPIEEIPNGKGSKAGEPHPVPASSAIPPSTAFTFRSPVAASPANASSLTSLNVALPERNFTSMTDGSTYSQTQPIQKDLGSENIEIHHAQPPQPAVPSGSFTSTMPLPATSGAANGHAPVPAGAAKASITADPMQRAIEEVSKSFSTQRISISEDSGLPISKPSQGERSGALFSVETAREFMDYYCKKFSYARADLQYRFVPQGGTTLCTALLVIMGRQIGKGEGLTKQQATSNAYLDGCAWLAKCDTKLWDEYTQHCAIRASREKAPTIASMSAVIRTPSLSFKFTEALDSKLRDVIWEARESELYKKAEELVRKDHQRRKEVAEAKRARKQAGQQPDTVRSAADTWQMDRSSELTQKSRELKDRLDGYNSNPSYAKMRKDRAALPVSTYADELMERINRNSVLVIMAATGSGKTTQLPQIILDHHILKGDGAKCNIVCTQPRRLAAISVAQRVANERYENLGSSVGYQVRFDNKPPQPDGSILFCTTGIFLRRLQLGFEDSRSSNFLNSVTHVVVDEVHERDVDVDLLLFVLKRHLAEQKKAGKEGLKIVLMSATIDPSLFCRYFKNTDNGKPAPAVEIPGRSYPVQKYYLQDVLQMIDINRHGFARAGWVLDDKDVKAYLTRELASPLDPKTVARTDDQLKLPVALIALTIAYVAKKSSAQRDGHILVFLPGFDEIKAVRRTLEDDKQSLLDVPFERYDIHILHSAIPIAEQQAVFAPAQKGEQRIILATNIAETSVTIPDVVCVIDVGKCKERRFDPERRMSSLVSAFTGTSNMQQRAGRAGRHRAGEYYSLVSEQRRASLPVNQTVEMKRLDLSSVVMHVKGMNIENMEVEDVLEACIEPPERERILAAIRLLKMVGALDDNETFTSLGHVLVQLPVEAAIGKLCLLGCVFGCLEQTLAIAAILTNRDPFIAPFEKRAQANEAKMKFSTQGFRSDVLTVLKAYNTWSALPDNWERGRFCDEFFLSRQTLYAMQQIQDQLALCLYRSGVLQIAAGPTPIVLHRSRTGRVIVPALFNINGESLPLITALMSSALAPNFAVRRTARLLRSPQDPGAMIHPSSILGKPSKAHDNEGVKNQVYAFAEATVNNTKMAATRSTAREPSLLRSVTLLDTLGLLLFGISKIAPTREGFTCDGWLPVTGNVALLDDIERFRHVLHMCMLRVFQGLRVAIGSLAAGSEDADSDRDMADPTKEFDDPPLSGQEYRNLSQLSRNLVNVLNSHAIEHGLPAYTKIAREASADDVAVDTIPRPFRNSVRASAPGQTTRIQPRHTNGTPSYGQGSEWDAWGQDDAQADVPAMPETPSETRAATPSNHAAAPPPTTTQNILQEDDWSSYKPAADDKDAYARRAAMTAGPSIRPATPAKHMPAHEGVRSPTTGQNNGWGRLPTSLRASAEIQNRNSNSPEQAKPASSSNSEVARPASAKKQVRIMEEPKEYDAPAVSVQPAAVAEDPWAAWAPTTSDNDAYDRRQQIGVGADAMRRTSVVDVMPAKAQPIPARPTSSSGGSKGGMNSTGDANSNTTKGWGQVIDDIPPAPADIQNGWDEPIRQVPAPFSAPITESSGRHPSVDSPTKPVAGWEPYSGYSSNRYPIGGNRSPANSTITSSNTSRTRTVNPLPPTDLSSQAEFPNLPPSQHQMPQPAVAAQPAPAASDWDSWQPSAPAEETGEEAFKRRAMKTRSGSVASSATQTRLGYTPLSEAPLPSSEPPAENGWNAPQSSQPDNSYRVAEESNFAISGSGWEAPSAHPERNKGWGVPARASQEPTRAKSPMRAQTPKSATTAAATATNEDDGWGSYTPAKSAVNEGEAAYQRRIQMSGGRGMPYAGNQDNYMRQQPAPPLSPIRRPDSRASTIQRPDSRASMHSRVYSRSDSPAPSHISRSKGEISIKGIASRSRKRAETPITSTPSTPRTPTKSTVNGAPTPTPIPAQITEVVIDWKAIEAITGKMGGLALTPDSPAQTVKEEPSSFSYSAIHSPTIIRQPELPATNGHFDEANFASRRKVSSPPPPPQNGYIGLE